MGESDLFFVLPRCIGKEGAWYPKAILLTIFMTDSFVRARLVAHRPGESDGKAVKVRLHEFHGLRNFLENFRALATLSARGH